MTIIQKRMLESHRMPGHKMPSIDQTPCGQTGTLSAELADCHSGPKHNPGLLDRPHIRTTTNVSATSPSPFNRTTTTGEGGSSRNAPEGSHQGNNPCKRVLLEPVPGPQEERGPTTSNKPQSSESICSEATFQNGGHPQSKGPVTARGLASQGRPEGCLLHHTNTQVPQTNT